MNTEFVTFLLLASLVSTVSGFPFRSEELIKELKTKEFQGKIYAIITKYWRVCICKLKKTLTETKV